MKSNIKSASVRRKLFRFKIKKFFIRNGYVFLLAVPFLLIDVFMRLLGRDVNYFQGAMVLPNIMFTLLWISLFLGISLFQKKRTGKIFYWLFFSLYFIFFIANSIYYSYTGFFFDFNLVSMASEGSSYILDTILHTSPFVYLMFVVVIATAVFCYRFFPDNKQHKPKKLVLLCTGFIVLHLLTPYLMGFANKSLEWDNWRNPRNVYNNFNDTNKNMKICGIFEFIFRDFYVTYLKPDDEASEEEKAFLEETYENNDRNSPNSYTGIFQGKNLICLQLEGMDSWLLNETDTPNLYHLMNNSFVFNNHYSYYTGGGSTFNSELAVNTSLITPVSFTRNVYTFNNNQFTYSLPNLFKKQGYRVNAFHMNTREYYSRGINYDNWGYDNYYGLLDENKYKDASYKLDRELILDEKFYKRMFQSGEPFVNSIITYTPHTPFDVSNGMGKLLYETVYSVEPEENQLTEEEAARLYASETDYMVGLLLQALQDNGLYDNTVIVAYADHYLYTLNDKTILDQYKTTDNNLINRTPFFIWSSGTAGKNIDKVNSQIDILPTVLNLFGVEYIPNYYVGRDIFDDNYTGYVFFSDYSWYDGNVYVQDGEIVNDGVLSPEELDEKNTAMNRLIQKNDLTLKYDYYKKLKQ